MRQIKRILMMLTLVATLSSCEDLKILLGMDDTKLEATLSAVTVDGFVNCYEISIPNRDKLKDLTMTTRLKEGSGRWTKVNGPRDWENENFFKMQYSIVDDKTIFSYWPMPTKEDKGTEEYLRPFKFDICISARGKDDVVLTVDIARPFVLSVSKHYSVVGRMKRLRFAQKDEKDDVERFWTDYSDATFSSDDESIATIDKQGFYTAHKVGKTILRAERDGQKIETPLEVIDMVAQASFTYKLNGEVFNSWDMVVHPIKRGEDMTFEYVERFPIDNGLLDGRVFILNTENLKQLKDGYYYWDADGGSCWKWEGTKFKLTPEEQIIMEACVDDAFTFTDLINGYQIEMPKYYYSIRVWFKLVD